MKVTVEDIIRLETKYGYIITDEKFAEYLLKLEKQESMKITEQTTIGELIPEGYELADNQDELNPSDQRILKFYILKKKPVKHFDMYKREYMRTMDIDWCKSNNPAEWQFEYRIGLLKFICDDIHVNYIYVLTELRLHSTDDFDKIKNICPEEFLNSLI